ncbi:MAG: hypothetical protein ACE5NM_13815 [Sedimentisphaerales bacterium]
MIDLRLGPRSLQLACQLIASVAVCCRRQLPLLLIDDHLPYPAAILQVFGKVKYRRRRKKGRGRKRKPTLKPPPNLLVGVVKKIRNSRGRLLEVTTYALFGRLKDIERRIRRLKIGRKINTSHLERLNGTLRGQQTRLARRRRNGSRLACALQWSLWLWRDLYNFTRVHGSLNGQTPAMCLGLAQSVWTVLKYVRYPVHVSELLRHHWAEQRKNALESPLDVYQRKKSLPIS